VTTNIERAQLVARSVQLLDVVLRDAKVSAPEGSGETNAGEFELEQKYRAWPDPPADGRLQVTAQLFLKASAADAEGVMEARLEIEAAFRLAYGLPADAEYPADAIRHFAEVNGVFNVWPYWRELVQSLSTRVGLPAIVLPVFRPQVRTLEPEESTTQDGAPDEQDSPPKRRRKRTTDAGGAKAD